MRSCIIAMAQLSPKFQNNVEMYTINIQPSTMSITHTV